jgi:hypothetical protein
MTLNFGTYRSGVQLHGTWGVPELCMDAVGEEAGAASGLVYTFFTGVHPTVTFCSPRSQALYSLPAPSQLLPRSQDDFAKHEPTQASDS